MKRVRGGYFSPDFLVIYSLAVSPNFYTLSKERRDVKETGCEVVVFFRGVVLSPCFLFSWFFLSLVLLLLVLVRESVVQVLSFTGCSSTIGTSSTISVSRNVRRRILVVLRIPNVRLSLRVMVANNIMTFHCLISNLRNVRRLLGRVVNILLRSSVTRRSRIISRLIVVRCHSVSLSMSLALRSLLSLRNKEEKRICSYNGFLRNRS